MNAEEKKQKIILDELIKQGFKDKLQSQKLSIEIDTISKLILEAYLFKNSHNDNKRNN